MKTIKLVLLLVWCLISLPLVFIKVPFMMMVYLLDLITVNEKKMKRMME